MNVYGHMYRLLLTDCH